LSGAIERVRRNRTPIAQWKEHRDEYAAIGTIAAALPARTGIPFRVVVGEPVAESATAPDTFFLSYSSRDSLLARQVYEDLTGSAQLNVWFDLAQPQRFSAGHDAAVSKWLEESVHASQGFVLVLTENALASGWVKRELEFAAKRGVGSGDSRIVMLKAQDVSVPHDVRAASTIVDCDGAWWSSGIAEGLEADAGVTGLPGSPCRASSRVRCCATETSAPKRERLWTSRGVCPRAKGRRYAASMSSGRFTIGEERGRRAP
jgi:TIR domain